MMFNYFFIYLTLPDSGQGCETTLRTRKNRVFFSVTNQSFRHDESCFQSSRSYFCFVTDRVFFLPRIATCFRPRSFKKHSLQWQCSLRLALALGLELGYIAYTWSSPIQVEAVGWRYAGGRSGGCGGGCDGGRNCGGTCGYPVWRNASTCTAVSECTRAEEQLTRVEIHWTVFIKKKKQHETNRIELNWTELNWTEMKWNEMRWAETRQEKVKWNEMGWDGMGWDGTKIWRWDEMRDEPG